jgi:uncharacterized protein YecE (DUF72 family)
VNFDRDQFKKELASLAAEGIFIGTSSWKYAGWRGRLYDEARYVYRGRFSESRFERNCLTEYAEVFKTVSVDAAYYQFPTARSLEGLIAQVPQDFQFSLKATDEITLKRFPNLPRFGARAGRSNPHFLDADLFQSAFLQPCETIRNNIGLIMFEFARISSEDFARGRDFVDALDQFLGRLPADWRYGVEVRTASLLQPAYFEVLARHNVAHIFNSWEAMPPVLEQADKPESFSARDFLGARFLLKPGRRYEEAVKLFSPYDRVKEPYPEGRNAAAHLIQEARAKKRKVFLYVNNRFEGNALDTIAAMLAEAALSAERELKRHLR